MRARDADSAAQELHVLREAKEVSDVRVVELEEALQVLQDAKQQAEMRARDADSAAQVLQSESRSNFSAVSSSDFLEIEISNLKNHGKNLLLAAEHQIFALTEKCSSLELEIAAKDDALAETENEIFQLRQESENACFSAENCKIKQLEQDLEAKDERIAHLEKSKLTKDQLDKIKQVKEDKARLSAENKELKERILKLNSPSGTNQDQNSLSNKVAELSKQLHVHDAERCAVLKVIQEGNISSESLLRDLGSDLQDAINKMLSRASICQANANAFSELEQRVQLYKDAARISRKEISELNATINELRARKDVSPSNEPCASSSTDLVSGNALTLEHNASEFDRLTKPQSFRKDHGFAPQIEVNNENLNLNTVRTDKKHEECTQS